MCLLLTCQHLETVSSTSQELNNILQCMRETVLAIARHCTVENHQCSHLPLWKILSQVILTASPDTQEVTPPDVATQPQGTTSLSLLLGISKLRRARPCFSSFPLTHLSPWRFKITRSTFDYGQVFVFLFFFLTPCILKTPLWFKQVGSQASYTSVHNAHFNYTEAQSTMLCVGAAKQPKESPSLVCSPRGNSH